MCGLVDNGRYELGCTATGADDHNPLAVQVDIMIPACRMKTAALEGPHPRYVRHGRCIQLATGADNRVELLAAGTAVSLLKIHTPAITTLVIDSFHHAGTQAHVLAQLVLVHNLAEVCEEFRLSGVVAGPLVFWRKDVIVQVVG